MKITNYGSPAQSWRGSHGSAGVSTPFQCYCSSIHQARMKVLAEGQRQCSRVGYKGMYLTASPSSVMARKIPTTDGEVMRIWKKITAGCAAAVFVSVAAIGATGGVAQALPRNCQSLWDSY